MSDFWSGLFLLGTIIAGAILIPVAIFVAFTGKKNTRISALCLGIFFALLFIWIADRIIAGMFCLPWECVNQDVPLETVLLTNADLPDGWETGATSNDTYVPRAATNYRERTFDYTSPLRRMVFYEEIYQYRSIRGASFQYAKLKKELPTSYSVHSMPVSPTFELRATYASEYDFGCVFYDMKVLVCYYLAHYDEYMLLLEMRSSDNDISDEIFSEIVSLVDKKLSNAINSLIAPAP